MGGVKTLKSLGGPFPEARFCPTGGVSPENLKSYLSLGSVVTAGGSWIATQDAIKRGDWDGIQGEAERAVELAQS